MDQLRGKAKLDSPVSRVNVSLEEFVLAKRCFADCALVREVSGLQRFLVVLCHVVQ